jgi:CRISPR-associated protein Csb2
MPSFFCISFTFHDTRFHGQRDGGAPEWPPSPLRVYQAIVAACSARASLDQARGALLWFERQSEPIIIAPAAFVPLPYRIAVPNNDLDVPARCWARGQEAPQNKHPHNLKSLKTICPVHFDGGDTVHYLYPLGLPVPAEEAKHMKALAALAPSITHLGWGIDLVAAHASVIDDAEAAKIRGTRWKPALHSSTRLRVPRAGVLDALMERHDAFLHRISEDGYTPVPPLSGFGVVAYEDLDQINRRPFAAFDLLPVDGADYRPRKSFRQEDAVHVAAMLRHAAWNAANKDLGDWRTEKWAQQFVAGHGPHSAVESFPRFSYIPLPTIGHSHADGMIRRVLMAETAGGDGRSADWAAQRLGGLALQDERGGAQVAFVKSAEIDGDTVFRAYCGHADRWQTITPVLFPGFDGNSPSKRLKLLLRCFDQTGIPRQFIADLDIQKSPWLAASAQTRAFKRSDRLKHLPAYHVRLYFKRPIDGPLVIGAGRHRGLGVFAAWD